MQAEIITIGDEILIGQVIDSNSAWIAQQLNTIGIDVFRITSISDTQEAIVGALDGLLADTKLVLITGGLGPTKDDITKHTLANYFEMDLEFKPEVFEHIEKLFAGMGRTPAPRNRRQAEVPIGSRVLFNEMGTAPGMLFQKNGRYIVSLPGVPYEMKFLMEKHVLPIVEKELVRQHIIHRTLLTVGLPESELADKLHDFEEALPSFIKMAYLPRPGMVRLRFSARGHDENRLKNGLDDAEANLRNILGNSIYGTEKQRLEQIIGELLAERGETLATAESCTGGYIAHLITSIPGCSRYFMGGVLAYANEVKVGQLGVDQYALDHYGAVSEAVVCQMAEGIRQRLGVTWALATSGIAGPDGGTTEKPVGTVWIALAGPDRTMAKKFQFGKDRLRNIKKSAFMGLDMLRNALFNELT
jgi:nicotinamide-nucleotide amidase